jgi:hypothetical protein
MDHWQPAFFSGRHGLFDEPAIPGTFMDNTEWAARYSRMRDLDGHRNFCHEKHNQFRHLNEQNRNQQSANCGTVRLEFGPFRNSFLRARMFDLIYTRLTDPHFMLSVLVAIATMATIVTIAMPLIENDTLGQRMNAVATERERIRARERERLIGDKNKRSLRQAKI